MQSQELKSRYGLSLQQEACLAVRSSPVACSRCAAACPAGVLAVGERGVSLADGCLGCGRCVASCPSGALSARGYQIPDGLPEGNRELAVECWKVPPRLLAAGTHAVPCLGGLSAASLLERVLATGEGRAVVLVDRGWCATCRAGGSAQPPVAAQLEFVRCALIRLGWPQQSLPEIRRDPLPVSLMPDEIPVPAEREAIGRRAFFSFLAGKAADVVIERTAPPLKIMPRSLIRQEGKLFPERIRLIAALERLAELRGVPLPADLFPAISISETCANHGVCARVCPTGALSSYEDDAATGIRFEPWLCASCGLCARSCPEGALELDLAPSVDGAMHGQRELTRLPWGVCTSCHERFASRGKSLCPRCEKFRSLAADLFGTMFA
ncbi:MAG: 4Fe-4S binding protein [Sulfuricella sp.]|nr:4Fe-4S binding protein [Sulfuricella sp.]